MTTENAKAVLRVEAIHSGKGATTPLGHGVGFREMVSGACTARGFSTGIVTIDPSAVLPYHTHPVCEALTILSGVAIVHVEGRGYRLEPFDCICLPAGVAHKISNGSADFPMMALSAVASPAPTQDPVSDAFPVQDRGAANPTGADPESVVRFAQAEVYELSPNALFAICLPADLAPSASAAGTAGFSPGDPCLAMFTNSTNPSPLWKGKRSAWYKAIGTPVGGYDTAFVPEGRPHRFLNLSNAPMAMVWVYAGSEPGRTLVESGYCDGTLAWP